VSAPWVKHGRLVADGVLGGDAVRLLKHASKAVIMSTLPWALCHPCCCHSGAWDEKSIWGDGANLIMDGAMMELGQSASARAELGVELD
jgi:hypothetical protein